MDLKTAEEVLPQEEKPNTGSVFDDLKERISSPFLFSFGISFLISNWKIFVGLFFLDKEDLKAAGYLNKVDFVSKNIDILSVFIYPLIAALLYCFLYPLWRDYIKVQHAKRLTKTTKLLNKVASSYPVPMTKYAAKVAEVNSLKESLSGLINKEGAVLVENTRLTLELADTTVTLMDKSKEMERLSAYSGPAILEGRWIIKNSGVDNELIFSGNQIKGRITYLDEGLVVTEHEIKNFIFNFVSNLTYFEISPLGSTSLMKTFFVLAVNKELTEMEGLINNSVTVLLEKKSRAKIL